MSAADFTPDSFACPSRRGRVLRHVFDLADGAVATMVVNGRPLVDPLTGANLRTGQRVREHRAGRWTVDMNGPATYAGTWWRRA